MLEPPKTKPNNVLLEYCKSVATALELEFFALYVQLIPHPDSAISAFMLFRGRLLIEQGWHAQANNDPKAALLYALVEGLSKANSYVIDRPLRIFLPNRSND